MCQFQSTIARHNSKRRIALMLELTLLAVDLQEGRRVGLQVEMIGLDLVGHPRRERKHHVTSTPPSAAPPPPLPPKKKTPTPKQKLLSKHALLKKILAEQNKLNMHDPTTKENVCNGFTHGSSSSVSGKLTSRSRIPLPHRSRASTCKNEPMNKTSI